MGLNSKVKIFQGHVSVWCGCKDFPIACPVCVGCRFNRDDARDVSKRESVHGGDINSEDIKNIVVFYVSLLFEE